MPAPDADQPSPFLGSSRLSWSSFSPRLSWSLRTQRSSTSCSEQTQMVPARAQARNWSSHGNELLWWGERTREPARTLPVAADVSPRSVHREDPVPLLQAYSLSHG